MIDCNLSIHHDCLANTESCPCPSVYSDSQIRSSFLNVFTSILRNYKDFLIEASPQIYSSAETAMSLQSIFRVDDFLADLDSESRNFMDQVVHTQSFFEFIRERTGDIKYETLFLSETINNKLNRSKLQVQKLPTSFLDDNGYAIKATLVLTGPNTTGLELKSGVESSSFPLHLNLDLIAAPRNIPTLMSDSDVQLMELYTKGILFQGAFHVPYVRFLYSQII